MQTTLDISIGEPVAEKHSKEKQLFECPLCETKYEDIADGQFIVEYGMCLGCDKRISKYND
jgi:hypothetical protein